VSITKGKGTHRKTPERGAIMGHVKKDVYASKGGGTITSKAKKIKQSKPQKLLKRKKEEMEDGKRGFREVVRPTGNEEKKKVWRLTLTKRTKKQKAPKGKIRKKRKIIRK